jgi:hypothetical protein
MPDHFHLLITPQESLERAMQFIKGGFSFRAKRELGFMHEIWQASFYDRRVRDAGEYFAFREYIRQNPRKRGLAAKAEHYPYSSAWPGLLPDGAPQRLKPVDSLPAQSQRLTAAPPRRHISSICRLYPVGKARPLARNAERVAQPHFGSLWKGGATPNREFDGKPDPSTSLPSAFSLPA